MTGRALRLLRIERTVATLAVAAAFYRDALDFTGDEMTSEAGLQTSELLGDRTCRQVTLHLGAQELWLTEFDPPGAPYPPDSRSADLWFQHFALIVSDIAAVHTALTDRAAAISTAGPVSLPPNTGGVTAWKFRDPDGHPLELLQFPPKVGDRQWHQQMNGRPILGIDHAAISVSDAEASITFYRDVLGLILTARGTNCGPEQEQLDALAGVVVEVVALNPAVQTTPHLELLAYQIPKGRKPAPSVQPHDIAGDRLVFEVDNLALIIARLSSDQRITNNERNDSPTALIRDPDGHLLILIESPGP